jgi:hypothetical protein
MESSLKLAGTLIVLTIILVNAFNLVNAFQQYLTIKTLANDWNNIGILMKSLKEMSDYGSWRKASITIPNNYSLLFNNETNKLEVHGSEEFNITINSKIIYSLNLSSGSYQLQLYYGLINHDELKNETLVFT